MNDDLKFSPNYAVL